MTDDQWWDQLPQRAAGVDAAFSRLVMAVATMDAEQLRAPSLLQGWAPAHMLAIVARNAESHIGMLRGSLAGEVVEQYPGAPDRRERDIEEGAGRGLDEIVDDMITTQATLVG